MLETFLKDFGSYFYDRITQLLQVCQPYIHDVNLPFHHISKVLLSSGNSGRSFEFGELIAIFKKPI